MSQDATSHRAKCIRTNFYDENWNSCSPITNIFTPRPNRVQASTYPPYNIWGPSSLQAPGSVLWQNPAYWNFLPEPIGTAQSFGPGPDALMPVTPRPASPHPDPYVSQWSTILQLSSFSNLPHTTPPARVDKTQRHEKSPKCMMEKGLGRLSGLFHKIS